MIQTKEYISLYFSPRWQRQWKCPVMPWVSHLETFPLTEAGSVFSPSSLAAGVAASNSWPSQREYSTSRHELSVIRTSRCSTLKASKWASCPPLPFSLLHLIGFDRSCASPHPPLSWNVLLCCGGTMVFLCSFCMYLLLSSMLCMWSWLCLIKVKVHLSWKSPKIMRNSTDVKGNLKQSKTKQANKKAHRKTSVTSSILTFIWGEWGMLFREEQ